MDIFFLIGIFFSLVGVIGIMRGKNIYQRIQSSMIIYSLGAFPILIALCVYNLYLGKTSIFIKIVLIIIILFLTIPLINSILLKNSYNSDINIEDIIVGQ